MRRERERGERRERERETHTEKIVILQSHISCARHYRD